MKRSLFILAPLALAACADNPTQLAPAAEAPALAAAAAPNFVPGEVIVKFRPGAAQAARGAALQHANAAVRERIVTGSMKRGGDNEGLTVIHSGLGTAAAIERLRANPNVEYAEPNYVYQHAAVSNDTYFTNGSLWGMYGGTGTPVNLNGSHASVAWAANHTDCSGVYVGIIDEGYMYTHTDLAANAGKNPGEVAGNGVDDDGNGYVDDVYGWDFDGNNNSVFDGTLDDHGTHVAGTIGGVGGNGTGVAGVCWSVKLLSGKFLGRNGGTTANAIKAVDYFTDLKTRHGINLVATNNSWGGGGFSQALQDAIERANAAGILFIAAAGNSAYNCETSSCYPGEYPNANVISVASITSSGAMSSFSNYGSTTVDIGAPGSGVYSTVPASSKGSVVSGYASYSGTSMASPHVAGAAALYAAYHPGSSAATIKSAILSSALPTVSLNGKTVTGARLNVAAF
ncbi:S8 family peptidase [Longimicrobium sp.]|uniref:S8 family peptidase n=1 Tax=Longimicrobium sp. TaxID=2029185 RepID=UPI003B3BE799